MTSTEESTEVTPELRTDLLLSTSKLGEHKRIEATIQGLLPILLYRGENADPFDPWAKKLKALTAKRNKNDELLSEIRDVEWRAAIWWSDRFGLYLPAGNLFAGIRDAAKAFKKGKTVTEGVIVYSEGKHGDAECVKIFYSGPQTLEKLAANPEYRDSRSVVMSGRRIIRTRGRVPAGWRLTFIIQYDSRTLEAREVVSFLQIAGFSGGMGDYRPRFGRFDVVGAHEI
jgi:hypothetical protein